MSDWYFWPKTKEERDERECTEVNGYEQGIIIIRKEKSTELATLEMLQRDWKDSFLHIAQRDVIKVAEGYFIVNPDGKYHRPPIFEVINPHPYCTLPRTKVER